MAESQFSEQEYVNNYHLESIFTSALDALLERRPEDPFEALSNGFRLLRDRFNHSNRSMTFFGDVNVKEIFSEAASILPKNDVNVFTIPHENNFNFTDSSAVTFNRERRQSVSAECYQPPKRGEERKLSIVIPKTNEQRARIEQSISRNLLFRNLQDDQKEEILGAMFERKVNPGTVVIEQGAEGDNFYVVDKGRFSVQVDGREVVQIGPGGSFGELALLYNTTRSATVVSLEEGNLWVVDRATFRRVVVDLAHKRRMMYEDFLASVPLLSTLEQNELGRIADALQPVTFQAGSVVVRQGEQGDRFYIIESGEAVVRQHPLPSHPSSDHLRQSEVDAEAVSEVEIGRLGHGDYFGELALINNAPRAATVVALTNLKCVTLSVADFIRLLGPVMDILRRNEALYRKYEDVIVQN